MPGYLRTALTLAAALSLSACLISKGDLFGPEEADYPITSGARFAIHPARDEDRSSRDRIDHVIITREGAYYVYAMDEEKPFTGLMDDVGGGAYIALLHDLDNPDTSMYALFRKSEENWLRYMLLCSDFEDLAEQQGQSLADFHVRRDTGDCLFTDYGDLKRAMSLIAAHAKPDAIYVPDQAN